MPIEAVPIHYLLEDKKYLTPTGVAERINEALERGIYVGYLVVTKPIYSAWDHRQNGDMTQGIVLLIDTPSEQQ